MSRHLSLLVLLPIVFPLFASHPAAAVEHPFRLQGSGTVINGVIQAAGTATRLGRFTETGTLGFTADPNDPNRVLARGNVRFTAARGDVLEGVITNASLDLTTGIGTGTFLLRRGTGRFEGATGSVGFAVMQNLATGEFEVIGLGTIDV
jgi:hypothetical protein